MHLLSRSCQGLVKVWRDLPKAHTEGTQKKYISVVFINSHDSYLFFHENVWNVLFLNFLKSLWEVQKIVIRLLCNCYQSLVKVWRDLPKAHTEGTQKKYISVIFINSHDNYLFFYKNVWNVLFLNFLKSLWEVQKIVIRLLCNCYQGLNKVWRDLRKSYLKNTKKYISVVFINSHDNYLFFYKNVWNVLFWKLENGCKTKPNKWLFLKTHGRRGGREVINLSFHDAKNYIKW